jgi:1-phosphofructokinase family hexose kinase
MILTVTPNPTIDRVLFVRDFAMQDVVRADGEAVSPSGKAIDVAAILHLFGVDTLALGLNAGLSGVMLAALLDELGVAHDFVPANGYTRVAALITDRQACRQSTIIAHTLTADESHLEELLTRTEARWPGCWGLVCAGSLPPGMPPNAYARLLSRAKSKGVTTLLDSSGESLLQGAQARPDILKMNRSELSALFPQVADQWQTDKEDDDVLARARELVAALIDVLGEGAAQAIVVTLGKRGVVAATPQGRWYAPALTVPYVSPAGAGDGMTSGIMLALYQGKPWREALAMGTAVAASVVANPSTCACEPVQVHALLPKVEVIEL